MELYYYYTTNGCPDRHLIAYATPVVADSISFLSGLRKRERKFGLLIPRLKACNGPPEVYFRSLLAHSLSRKGLLHHLSAEKSRPGASARETDTYQLSVKDGDCLSICEHVGECGAVVEDGGGGGGVEFGRARHVRRVS